MILLIDLENVGEPGLDGLEKLAPKDKVYLFYNNTMKLSIGLVDKCCSLLNRIEYIECKIKKKNSLDFQLVSLLGILIGSGTKGPFYIVSNDTGFDSAISFIKERYGKKKQSLIIRRFACIRDAHNSCHSKSVKKQEASNVIIMPEDEISLPEREVSQDKGLIPVIDITP